MRMVACECVSPEQNNQAERIYLHLRDHRTLRIPEPIESDEDDAATNLYIYPVSFKAGTRGATGFRVRIHSVNNNNSITAHSRICAWLVNGERWPQFKRCISIFQIELAFSQFLPSYISSVANRFSIHVSSFVLGWRLGHCCGAHPTTQLKQCNNYFLFKIYFSTIPFPFFFFLVPIFYSVQYLVLRFVHIYDSKQ